MTNEQMQALNIAGQVHKGQRRNNGRRYIEHPCRVADLVRSCGGSKVQIMAGFLHDALEDCPPAKREHYEHKIMDELGAETLQLVIALTHEEGETYGDYLGRVMSNEDARLVKICDMFDNIMETPTHSQVVKYVQAMVGVLDGVR